MRFGTLCSGIEGASEAWLPLGWECAYVAEIEPFPCAYLAEVHGAGRPRHMPDPETAETPKEAKRRRAALKALNKARWGDKLINFGDISQVKASDLPPVDIIGAGLPCQDFSIAGLRASLDGHRGNLSIIGVGLILEAANLGLVRGAVLEQVPDVLNTADNAWGNILGALVGADDPLQGLDHGGRWPSQGMVEGPRARVAWRIFDAQWFGLAQRRERVWAVVDFGDGPDPCQVLLEPKSLHGNPASRPQPGQDLAPTLAGGARERGGYSYDDVPQVATAIRARDGAKGVDSDATDTLIPTVAGTLGTDMDRGATGQQARAGQLIAAFGGNNTSGPIEVATARTASHTASGRQDFETETFVVATTDVSPSLRAQAQASHRADSEVYIAHMLRGEGFDASEDGTGRGTPLVPTASPAAFNLFPVGPDSATHAVETDVSHALTANGDARKNGNGLHIAEAVAFSLRGREGGAMPEVEVGDVSPALRAADGGSTRPFIAAPMAVRRITVVEAERLQGFRDNATLIHWPSAHRKGADLAETIAYLRGHGFSLEDATRLAQTPDGARYKAIGNSWPVPVVSWLGRRIEAAMPKRP